MIKVPFYWLDVFTSKQFKGNPAAVCLMKTDYEDKVYQSIAAELKLSETAFTEKIKDNEYKLRWFTPTMEAPLCGHATMATAHTLFTKHDVKSPIMFHTMSGVMKVEKDKDGIALNFPFYSLEKTDDLKILEPLGIKDYVEVSYSNIGAFAVVLKDSSQVTGTRPDFTKLRELCVKLNILGVVVTAIGSGSVDFVFRVFAPGAGIDEDQGTGIAHCVIARYWGSKLEKSKMRTIQLSERGSEMVVEVGESGVRITGKVTELIEGQLHIQL
jgi:PhzF family phenazine biosynthesis protein